MLINIATVTKSDLNGLNKTLESIKKQTLPPKKLIIKSGDDNKTEIQEIARKHCLKTETIILSGQDSGIYSAMNATLIHCDQKAHVLFLNSGDYLYSEETLEKLTTLELIDSETYVYWSLKIERQFGLVNRECENLETIKYRMPFSHQSVLIPVSRLLKRKGFNEKRRICADYEFLRLEYKEGYKFKKIDNLYSVRTEGGVSDSKKSKALRELATLHLENRLYLPAFNSFNRHLGHLLKETIISQDTKALIKMTLESADKNDSLCLTLIKVLMIRCGFFHLRMVNNCGAGLLVIKKNYYTRSPNFWMSVAIKFNLKILIIEYSLIGLFTEKKKIVNNIKNIENKFFWTSTQLLSRYLIYKLNLSYRDIKIFQHGLYPDKLSSDEKFNKILTQDIKLNGIPNYWFWSEDTIPKFINLPTQRMSLFNVTYFEQWTKVDFPIFYTRGPEYANEDAELFKESKITNIKFHPAYSLSKKIIFLIRSKVLNFKIIRKNWISKNPLTQSESIKRIHEQNFDICR